MNSSTSDHLTPKQAKPKPRIGHHTTRLPPAKFLCGERRKAIASRRALHEFKVNQNNMADQLQLSPSNNVPYMNILPSIVVKKFLKRNCTLAETSLLPSSKPLCEDVLHKASPSRLKRLYDPSHERTIRVHRKMNTRRELNTLRRRLYADKDYMSGAKVESLASVEVGSDEPTSIIPDRNLAEALASLELEEVNHGSMDTLSVPYPFIKTSKRIG